MQRTLVVATVSVLLAVGIVGDAAASRSAAGAPLPAREAPTDPDPAKSFQVRTAPAEVIPVAESGATGDVFDAAAPPASRTDGVAGGYVFVPINPYRTFDSRDYANGYLLGGEEVWFDVITNTNGVQMIPSGAVAVTYNLAITASSSAGYLSLYPADVNWPGNASINWTSSGMTLSNGGTVAIGYYDGPGEVAVYCGPVVPGVGTDYVIDITGYYI